MVDERTRLEIFDQPDSISKTLSSEYEKIDGIAQKIVCEYKVERLFLIAMGSSFSAALGGKLLASKITTLPVEVYRGYELEFDTPAQLGKDSCVVAISFSGETEDIVSALKFAKSKGSYVVSLSGPEENTLAKEADDSIRIISRDTKAMVAAYPTQLVLIYLLVGFIAKYKDGVDYVERLKRDIDELIPRLRNIIVQAEPDAEKLAKQFKDEQLFYVISAGPNYGLAYKLAMTELTENAWRHAVVQYSTESRHGIVEKIEKGLPVIFLVGTDNSRVDLLRELDTCIKLGARTIVWDAAEFPSTDPFLAPLYLSIPTEWFVYHLALKNGKMPSERRFMGSVVPYANMKSIAPQGKVGNL